MTTVNHQCFKCLITVWLQEINDGEDIWYGAVDADCGCVSYEDVSSNWDDDQ